MPFAGSDPSVTDGDVPAPGAVFFYVMRTTVLVEPHFVGNQNR